MRDSMIEIVSVAGIIGLAIIGVAAFGYIYTLATGVEVKAPEWLVGAVGWVVGYFYGKRGNGGNNGAA